MMEAPTLVLTDARQGDSRRQPWDESLFLRAWGCLSELLLNKYCLVEKYESKLRGLQDNTERGRN